MSLVLKTGVIRDVTGELRVVGALYFETVQEMRCGGTIDQFRQAAKPRLAL